MENRLFSAYEENGLKLKNRIVMAPMTRSRAEEENTPNDLMAEYYEQRTGAGLIITEGTAPSPNGLGYARIPGIYSRKQIDGWRRVTDRVHDKGSKIFIQLMHTGRVSHELNMLKVQRSSPLQPLDLKERCGQIRNKIKLSGTKRNDYR